MPSYYVRETFFRPRECTRRHGALPAAVYNSLQLLITRGGGDSLFIPIRSMQYQAVLARKEIIFVDSHGGYAHRDGEGGRLIRIAWLPAPAAERTSLNAPVPCDIVHYFPGLKETQWRLMSEFPPVLQQILERQRGRGVRAGERCVVPLHRSG